MYEGWGDLLMARVVLLLPAVRKPAHLNYSEPEPMELVAVGGHSLVKEGCLQQLAIGNTSHVNWWVHPWCQHCLPQGTVLAGLSPEWLLLLEVSSCRFGCIAFRLMCGWVWPFQQRLNANS